MKKFNCLVRILQILIGLNLVGCSLNTSNTAFEKLVSTNNINQDILLGPLNGTEKVFDGEIIILSLANKSDHIVKFSADYGIRLFLFDKEKDQWLEIPNRTSYKIVSPEGQSSIENSILDSEGRIQLFPFGSPFEKPEITPISAEPDLRGINRPVTLRVLVLGVRDDNGTKEEKVASFYDIVINP